MQHRATPGRHRRTEALHSHRAPRRLTRRPVTSPPAAAIPAADPNAGGAPATDLASASTAADALTSSADAQPTPIPVGPPPVRSATGPRHRAPATPIAPALLGERGRHAVMTAALVAGVGVAGVSSATASAGPARGAVTDQAPTLAAHLPSTTASTPVAGLSALTAVDTAAAAAAATGATTGEADLTASRFGAAAGGSTANRAATALDGTGTRLAAGDAAAPIGGATLGGVRSARKERPVPVVAQWVHPMPEGSVTSCFGPRWGRLHAGVDLAAASGTPIRATGAGTVVRAAAADGYGLAVLIDHGNGYLTHYGHMSALGVVAGQRVTAGQEIGKEGSTGHSTGPHLHFEVHEGGYKNPVEPTAWMLAHGVDLGGCTVGDEEHADHGH